MKSRNKKRLLALVLCMVVAISNSSFIFASETGQTEYPQEAEVQTQDEAVANDMDVAAYAADEGQAVAEEQPAAVEQVAAEPETTAENQAAQPVAEAPAAEQPTTEAPAAQEPAAAPTEETAPASENATAETPEEDATQAEAENQQLTWSQAVGNTTVNVTAEAGALPADAQLSVTEITAEDEVKEIEKAVEEKAIEEQFSIKNIFSYDIKFLVNGSEVQPTIPVQVSVDTPEITSSEDAAVLHVDDNNVAEDMKGAVDGEGKVVFDAPHFSTYVIVNKGGAEVQIKLQHYYYDTNNEEKKLYADQTVTLQVGSKIEDYRKSTNYDVVKVKEIAEDGTETEVPNFNEISVTGNKTYRIYYKENTSPKQGAVKFWDYAISWENRETNINSDRHYTGEDTNNRMTMGTSKAGNNQNGLDYNAYGTNKLNANKCNYGTNTGGKGTLGLLKGLSADYQTVLWNVDQPGFFTDDYKGEGKTIYTDYKLNFNRSGNHYTLDSVQTPNNETKKAGADFWPLGYENFYFGMRYDVEFEIGDYVGPMDYKFTGDDDLWVLLDGKVVIDVGGIHDALEGSTDLWKDLGYPDGKRPGPYETAAKTKKHRITVLYMERGAGKSNCQMEFTLPNSRILDVTDVPKATLSLKKVNSKDEAISGAEFKLVSKTDENDYVEVTSNTNGFVTFNNLKEGVEYTLTEESVPGDYITETTIWTVKLERDSSNTLKAVLYNNDTKLETDADGTYHIVNYKPEELVNQSVESNKTVSLLDWDQRTYKIDLTASSKVTQSTTVSVPFDIVMVLDVSGSMKDPFYEYSKYTGELSTRKSYYIKTSSGIYEKIKHYNGNEWYYYDTYKSNYVIVTQGSTDIFTKKQSGNKLTALKNAATSFVDNVATKNPDNRISVVTFAESSKIKKSDDEKWLLRTGDSVETIKSWISKLSAEGATNSAAGLDSAVNVFDSKNSGKWEDVTQKTGRQKMVVFLTDGVPTKSNEFSTDVANGAKANAKTLKDQGATIYSLGIFDPADSSGEISEGTVKQIDDYMKSVASADEKYMTADSVSSLNGLFDSITNSMPVTVKATVTDVIDSRFELTDDSRAKLEADGATIQGNTDGPTTITWANTEIPGKKDSGTSDTERAGWHKEIFIKAKDKYIGGNDVPTNGAGSGIDVGNNHAEFPQPTVNVKVDFNIGKDETVIFKGDELSHYFTDVVANGITKLISTTGPEYTMLGDVNVSTEWYTDAECRNETTKEAIQAAKPAAENVYCAKVTVTPKTDGSASSANSVGDKKVPGEYYKVDSSGVAKTGTYTVKVVSGAIQIEKQLETKAAKDETFTFSIKGTDVDGFIPIDVSITIKAGETKGTLSNEDMEKLKSLPRGTYEVTEVDTNGYTIQKVNATDKTNCYFNVADDKVSFTLGSDSNQEDVIQKKTYETAGILGVAAFTNEKVTSNWGIKKVSASNKDYTISGAVFKLAPTASGSSLPTYYGKSQDGGTVKWYSNSDCTTEITGTIQKGSYTLSEITAPTGYVRSTETWSIEIASKGALKSIQSGGQEIAENKIKNEIVDGKEVVYYLYENEVVYDLPSTGHTGIFNILMSGILLMFAGILIIYKMKGKEVLKK
jgi:fibro-slime domain-containing protein